MTVAEVLQTNLSDQQCAAATDPATEILTLACAGSGKSRTLAYRIAWLIAARGADASSIVAFTFTEKAADSIKHRVSDALQRCGLDTNLLGRMYIGTIHSFCQHLLGRINARYRQFDVLDENRLKLYLIEKYGAFGLQNVRGARGYFANIARVANAWATMNEEMVTPAAIAAHDADIGAVLAQLDTGLAADQFIDFSLMQRLAVEALQSADPQAQIAIANLRHVLVDEYQDINPVQEALITELCGPAETLFVVGDDDQSIYAWRGADVTRIQTFQQRFQNASTHTLAINYRSTPLIVSSADNLAHQELGAQRIAKNPVAAANAVPSELRVLWFSDRAEEADWVLEKIQQLLGTRYVEADGTARGLTPADFAILMRSTRQNEPNDHPPRHVAYTSRLHQFGIPYALEAGGGLFDRPHVAVLRDLFESLRNGQPTRQDIHTIFRGQVQPLFVNANFQGLAHVMTAWGRLIHTPVQPGMPRRRIYPQQLLFDILASFGIADAALDDGVLQDIGVFSRIMQDVEAVYPSVDSTWRFTSILNFLSQVAENGYDTSSSEIVSRPDAVTVSTVHKMKGLEFPVVFVVDVEANRFPGRLRGYEGMVPMPLIQVAVARGAYRSTREEEARLFYTAMTRAERFLYITGSAQVPGGVRQLARSPFGAHLQDQAIVRDPVAPTTGLTAEQPRRRIETSNLPTSYSDVRYYLRCPRDYQFRKVFGFSPAIPELFGFGKTVHTSVGKLHEQFPDTAPTQAQARQIAEETFHLKHVRPSNDPVNRPGPYERAKNRAAELVEQYAADFGGDFQQRRQVEERFEIPVRGAVVSGAIDLMICEDVNGNVVDACVIDFKAIEGGDDPAANPDLEWTELALQVQLYAKAARDVLGEAIHDGHVHLLKDNQRVTIDVGTAAVSAALANVEWAVEGIVNEHFPMRPHQLKCAACDFRQLCPKRPELFVGPAPPAIHVPGPGSPKMAGAFSLFDPNFVP